MFSTFSFGFFDSVFPIMFFVIFAIVIGVFISTAVKGFSTWNKNNHAPRLIVEATVVSKRMDVSHHHHSSGNTGFHNTSTYTHYYVTFEVQSGDRMELSVSGDEYGLLIEGDLGTLTFQGTRYLGFERAQS